MIDKRHKELINKLIEKTETKKANWYKTSGNDEYKIALEKSVITVDHWEDRGNWYSDFRILNERGDTISMIIINHNDSREDYNLLVKLHTLAKENYFRVDETISEIFDELESTDEIGKKGEEYDDLPF